MCEPSDSPATPKSPRWPWICLLAAMAWVAIVRVPIVLNADSHLDSDLAVDGLTLIEATQGYWRWHFPGTPYMGTPPVWLSLPGALLFGTNSRTLVVGGVIAYELVVLAIFALAWRTFGPKVAAWSLVPLAFASVGTVWLSGRLTGGHLLTVAWHAAALAMVPRFPERGGYVRAFGYGLWCGFGYYLDGMFLMTLPFAALLALKEVFKTNGLIHRLALIAFMAAGFVVGDVPREIGLRVDPRDAYPDQFATILDRDAAGNFPGAQFKPLLWGHLDLLGRECLPRLITGHRLTSFDLPTEPRPQALASPAPRDLARRSPALAYAVVCVSVVAFLVAMGALVAACLRIADNGVVSVPWAVLSSSFLCLIFFVLNRNIFNSDNYRYLVYMLVPWSLGFGLAASRLWQGPAKAKPRSGGSGRRLSAVTLAFGIAILFTIDTLEWYRELGWVDASGLPVRRPLDDPALEWLRRHGDAPGFFGEYWDVYRYQFLLGGKPIGVPFPVYPDRYDAAQGFPNRQPELMVARKMGMGAFYIDTAKKEGGRVVYQDRDRIIMNWVRPN